MPSPPHLQDLDVISSRKKGASSDILKYLGRIILGYPGGPKAIKLLCEEQVKRPGEMRGQGEEGLWLWRQTSANQCFSNKPEHTGSRVPTMVDCRPPSCCSDFWAESPVLEVTRFDIVLQLPWHLGWLRSWALHPVSCRVDARTNGVAFVISSLDCWCL